MAIEMRSPADAARIYSELGNEGARKYAYLINECNELIEREASGEDVSEELSRINQALYELKQEAYIVSSR
jgi:hypothetical protein